MDERALTAMSRAEVDRAGALLRVAQPKIQAVRAEQHITRGDFTMGTVLAADFTFKADDPDHAESIAVAVRNVLAYREGNGFAMQTVHRDIGPGFTEIGAAVSSRHKRMQAILDKLQRYPHMRLSQMDDIAGCRVVVQELSQVDAVRHALENVYEVHDVDDYIADPKRIGYRALHVVLNFPETNVFMRPGSDATLVEVQVRTARQNEWADQIESATGTTGYDLKGGDPQSLPEDLVEYVRVASDIRALADRGDPPDTELEERLVVLREIVRPYFQAR